MKSTKFQVYIYNEKGENVAIANANRTRGPLLDMDIRSIEKATYWFNDQEDVKLHIVNVEPTDETKINTIIQVLSTVGVVEVYTYE